MSPQGFKTDFLEALQPTTYISILSLSRCAFTDQAPRRRAGPGSARTTSGRLCSQATSLLSTRVLARSHQEECPFLPHQSGPFFIPSKQTVQIAEVHSLSSHLYLDHFQGMFFLRRTWHVSCPSSQDCVPAPGRLRAASWPRQPHHAPFAQSAPQGFWIYCCLL